MPNPCIPCPMCGFTMKPVWYLEKELDNHSIPTGRTHKESLNTLRQRAQTEHRRSIE